MVSLLGLRNSSVVGPVKVVANYDGNPQETMATGAVYLHLFCGVSLLHLSLACATMRILLDAGRQHRCLGTTEKYLSPR